MAYHNHHLSQNLPLHRFTDQQQHQDNNSLRPQLPSAPDLTTKPGSDPHHPLQTAPNWLNNALLRTQYDNDNNNNVNAPNGTDFLNLHTAPASDSSTQWLSRPVLHRNQSEVIDDVATLSHDSGDLKPNTGEKSEAAVDDGVGGGEGLVKWQNARYKAEILAHPLYEQLLSAHVSCLRIATPVDQLPRIDAQLAESQNVVAKYSAYGHGPHSMLGDDKELDHFLVFFYAIIVRKYDHLIVVVMWFMSQGQLCFLLLWIIVRKHNRNCGCDVVSGIIETIISRPQLPFVIADNYEKMRP